MHPTPNCRTTQVRYASSEALLQVPSTCLSAGAACSFTAGVSTRTDGANSFRIGLPPPQAFATARSEIPIATAVRVDVSVCDASIAANALFCLEQLPQNGPDLPTPSACAASGFPFPGFPADSSAQVTAYTGGSEGGETGTVMWRNPGDSAAAAQPLFARLLIIALSNNSNEPNDAITPTMQLRVSAGGVPLLEFLGKNETARTLSSTNGGRNGPAPPGGICITSALFDPLSETASLVIGLSGVGVAPADNSQPISVPAVGYASIRIVAMRSSLPAVSAFNLRAACGVRAVFESARALNLTANASIFVDDAIPVVLLATGAFTVSLNGLTPCTSYAIAATVACSSTSAGGCLPSLLGSPQELAYEPVLGYTTPCAPSAPPSAKGDARRRVAIIAGAAVATLAVLSIFGGLVWWRRAYLRRTKQERVDIDDEMGAYGNEALYTEMAGTSSTKGALSLQ
jgi:hypothetical protein